MSKSKWRSMFMKHINTIVNNGMKKTGNIGCGECQSSCQSACKTSCTVGNQSCRHQGERINTTKKPLLFSKGFCRRGLSGRFDASPATPIWTDLCSQIIHTQRFALQFTTTSRTKYGFMIRVASFCDIQKYFLPIFVCKLRTHK